MFYVCTNHHSCGAVAAIQPMMSRKSERCMSPGPITYFRFGEFPRPHTRHLPRPGHRRRRATRASPRRVSAFADPPRAGGSNHDTPTAARPPRGAVRCIADHIRGSEQPCGHIIQAQRQHTHGLQREHGSSECKAVPSSLHPPSAPRHGVARAVGFSREVGDEPDKVADRDGRRDTHGEDAGVVVVPGGSKGGEIGGCVGGG